MVTKHSIGTLNGGNKEVCCDYWDKRENGSEHLAVTSLMLITNTLFVLVLFLAPILILIMIIIAIMMEVIC